MLRMYRRICAWYEAKISADDKPVAVPDAPPPRSQRPSATCEPDRPCSDNTERLPVWVGPHEGLILATRVGPMVPLAAGPAGLHPAGRHASQSYPPREAPGQRKPPAPVGPRRPPSILAVRRHRACRARTCLRPWNSSSEISPLAKRSSRICRASGARRPSSLRPLDPHLIAHTIRAMMPPQKTSIQRPIPSIIVPPSDQATTSSWPPGPAATSASPPLQHRDPPPSSQRRCGFPLPCRRDVQRHVQETELGGAGR